MASVRINIIIILYIGYEQYYGYYTHYNMAGCFIRFNIFWQFYIVLNSVGYKNSNECLIDSHSFPVLSLWKVEIQYLFYLSSMEFDH